MMRFLRSGVVFLFLILLGGACSSGSKNVYSIQEIVSQSLRIRRPVGKGADPHVGPGGIDYQSHPLPNEAFDCQHPSALFENMKLKAIRSCLLSLEKTQKPREWTYRLHRKDQPEWVLEEELEEGQKPSCLSQVLPVIPIPREIFFQTAEKEWSCMASRLPIEADKFLGWTLPKNKLALQLSFPNGFEPSTDLETIQILVGWSLTPFFWTDDQRKLQAKVVPRWICEACLEGKMIQEKPGQPLPHWP